MGGASARTPDSPPWTPLRSIDVLAYSIRRGRGHELDRIETGTAIIILNNESANYWPDNTSGLYTPNILPGKRVEIRVNFSSTDYELYTGYISKWTPSFMSGGGKGPIVTVKLKDVQRNFSRLLLNNAGEAEEISDVRIGNVLDEIGWPAGDRVLDTGETTLQATGAQANINAMSHLFLVQETENGIIFQRPDGKVAFQSCNARAVSPFDTIAATLAEGGR